MHRAAFHMVVALTAIALAVPPAQAASIEGTLDASAVHVEGQSDTQASLVGLFVDLAFGTGSARPDFVLDAPELRIETDHADPVVETSVTPVVVEPDVMVDIYENARIEGMQFQDDHEIQVVPLNQQAVLQVNDECGSLRPSESSSVARIPLVRTDERPDLVADTAQATRWSGCDQSTVTITGDFLVVTWGHKAELTTSTESKTLQSGRMPSEQSPHPAADDAVCRHQQLYLYATNATLTFPLVAGEYGLFLTDASTQTEGGAVILQEAAGVLLDSTFRGQEVRLEGSVRLDLSGMGVDAPLQVSVAGDVDRFLIDSSPVPFASTTAPATPTAWWLLPFLTALPVAWVLQRRIRAKRHYRQAQRLARLRPKQAMQEINRAIALRPRWGEAYHLRAMLWTRMRRLREALADHEAAHAHLSGTLREQNAREAYRSCARLCDVPALMEWQKRFQFRRLPVTVRR